LEFLIELLVLLLFAKVMGEVFHHYGFSPLVGEVAAGIMLGPAALGIIAQNPRIEAVAMLGLIILMLVSGMNSRFDVLARIRFKSTVVSLTGVCLSLLLGSCTGYILTGNILSALFIGAVLSNTATEVVVRFTAKSHLSHLVTGAAIIDDIIAVYILGLVSTITLKQALGLPPDISAVLLTTLGIAAFFIVVAYLSRELVVRLNVIKRLWGFRGKGVPVTFAAVLALLLAVIARYVGLHEIIGAYMAGLFIGRLRERPDAMLLSRIRLNALLDDMSNVMQAVLTPFFFAYVGLLLPSLQGINLLMFLAFLGAALAGKMFGAGLGAALLGYGWRDSVRTGLAMCARGSLELAMLQVGLVTGILSANVYLVMVVTVLATAILSPVLFRLAG